MVENLTKEWQSHCSPATSNLDWIHLNAGALVALDLLSNCNIAAACSKVRNNSYWLNLSQVHVGKKKCCLFLVFSYFSTLLSRSQKNAGQSNSKRKDVICDWLICPVCVDSWPQVGHDGPRLLCSGVSLCSVGKQWQRNEHLLSCEGEAVLTMINTFIEERLKEAFVYVNMCKCVIVVTFEIRFFVWLCIHEVCMNCIFLLRLVFMLPLCFLLHRKS